MVEAADEQVEGEQYWGVSTIAKIAQPPYSPPHSQTVQLRVLCRTRSAVDNAPQTDRSRIEDRRDRKDKTDDTARPL